MQKTIPYTLKTMEVETKIFRRPKSGILKLYGEIRENEEVVVNISKLSRPGWFLVSRHWFTNYGPSRSKSKLIYLPELKVVGPFGMVIISEESYKALMKNSLHNKVAKYLKGEKNRSVPGWRFSPGEKVRVKDYAANGNFHIQSLDGWTRSMVHVNDLDFGFSITY